MEPMEDENCSDDFEEVYNSNKSADDLRFDQIISQFQEIVIDPHFEKTLTSFMKNNWAIFDQNSSKQQEIQVFEAYKNQLKQYLEHNIRQKIPDFDWVQFGQLFQSRRNLIDEQMLDTFLSLEEVQSFKSFIKDYRNSYEEEEMLKVLTIKSNKISQNKKVKGKDNIFSGGNQSMFDKGLKAPLPKKKQVVQKTQEELFVPELILTVKPMRKG